MECQFGEMGVIGVRVRWCSSTSRLLPLALLILKQLMVLSRSELGINIRGVVGLGDVHALVNFGLWGDVRLVVGPSALALSMTLAASVPLAMAAAIIATSGLTWGSQGINTLDRARVLRVKTILSNGIREEVSHCLEIQAVIQIGPDHFNSQLQEGMLDAC